MSHELEMVNGKAMMAYRASEGRPWHRLGTAVGDDLTPQEMMQAAGLDWRVETVETVAFFGEDIIPTGAKALIRETDHAVLAPMIGNDWNPVQNADAFNFFNEFVSSGDIFKISKKKLQIFVWRIFAVLLMDITLHVYLLSKIM